MKLILICLMALFSQRCFAETNTLAQLEARVKSLTETYDSLEKKQETAIQNLYLQLQAKKITLEQLNQAGASVRAYYKTKMDAVSIEIANARLRVATYKATHQETVATNVATTNSSAAIPINRH